jgi:hypothetical protein
LEYFSQCLKDYGLAGQPSSLMIPSQKAAVVGMKGFHYVYILVSEANDEVHYSGITRQRTLKTNRDILSNVWMRDLQTSAKMMEAGISEI